MTSIIFFPLVIKLKKEKKEFSTCTLFFYCTTIFTLNSILVVVSISLMRNAGSPCTHYIWIAGKFYDPLPDQLTLIAGKTNTFKFYLVNIHLARHH